MEIITGMTNAKVKSAVNLEQKKYRDKHKLFILEGLRNAEMVQDKKADVKMCFCTEKMLKNPRAAALIQSLEQNTACSVYQVSDNIYAKLSDTKSPQGLMLIVKQNSVDMEELNHRVKENSFFLVLDRLQDPGNIGTIIRTADAMGADGIICLNGTADVFSPKVVRSAMGSLFNLPICIKASEENLSEFALKNNLKVYASALEKEAKAVWDIDYKKSCIVILGNEANGVSDSLLKLSDEKIYIPMKGNAESLNVANAAAMIIYERCRQNI